MTDTRRIPNLIVEAGRASEVLRDTRERARVEAIAAIRAMERALLDALAGETLKGIRDIAPGYAAARVRSVGRNDVSIPYEPLPEPRPGFSVGREVLVVTAYGRLDMAHTLRVDQGSIVVGHRPADDPDLLIEDVEHLARLFAELLGEHVARARKTAERFGHLDAIAQRISAALLVA